MSFSLSEKQEKMIKQIQILSVNVQIIYIHIYIYISRHMVVCRAAQEAGTQHP